MWNFFFENQDEYFGKLTFCEFNIFMCPAHKMKFYKKSNYFFLEKMLNFISITFQNKPLCHKIYLLACSSSLYTFNIYIYRERESHKSQRNTVYTSISNGRVEE